MRKSEGRTTEGELLFSAIVLGLLAFALVWAAVQPREPLAWLYPLAVSLALWLAHIVLGRLELCADELILPLIAVPLLLSIAVLYHLDRRSAFWQVIWAILGLGSALAVVAFLPSVASLRRWWPLFLVLGLALLATTLFFGVEVYGARSWLVVGPVRFQPSEPAKVLFSLALAGYLAGRKELLMVRGWRVGILTLPHPAYFGPLVLVLLLALALMVGQRDLGTALLIFGLFACELYVAAPRLDYLFLGLVALAGGGFVGYRFFDHVRARIDVWLNPWAQAGGSGYQLVQSILAVSAGGILGAGFGQGQAQLIPAVTTDLTFAAWAEETGLAGSLALVALYLILTERGFRAALAANDDFSALVGVGLTSLFALQSLVILGGALRLIPLTGLTLPLFNYGGSSLVSTLISFGFLLLLSAEGPAA
ncbi:MAG: hypothetical protein PWQ41_1000 [Bacillota bacterium]|jgi:cell division protein FtsW|nr:hypothetical protein [Bacillota bacterium]MDK2855082.1 hypothetical protein [Bacillota bacterium]MDK2925226.1 hypothetical protein [Bacillota bacterium]